MKITANLLLLGILGVVAACAPGEQEKKVRVVLITLDTLRMDRLLGKDARMPELLEHAQSGQICEEAYSATATTQPTHATLLTGLQPWEHGVTRNGMILGAERLTLAELFQAGGYATRSVVASFPLHHQFGFDQGFDAYDDLFDQGSQARWSGLEVKGSFYRLADEVERRALAQLDASHEARQFFWFHFYDPHAPYGDTGGKPLPFRALTRSAKEQSTTFPALLEQARKGYDLDVLALDAALGRLLDRLRADESEYETHILLVADHGESFGEDGSLGHGKRLIPSQTHVPCILWSPQIIAGSRNTQSIGTIDAFSTLLQFGDLSMPEAAGGHSIVNSSEANRMAVGMRRSYQEPYADARTSGETVLIQGAWFFAQRNGQHVVGNSEGVTAIVGDALTAEESASFKVLFLTFERELDGSAADEVLDPAALDALSDLGYVR